MLSRMETRHWLLLVVALAAAEGALAQGTLRGQIFGPDGKHLFAEVRFQIISSDGSFQQYYFSDSNGRIIVPGLRTGRAYTLIVDTDGSTHGSARETFNLENLQYLNIFLPPLEAKKQPRPATKTTSARTLSRDVPRDAARSYSEAMELVQKGKLADSVRLFETAVARYNRFFEAYNDLGVVYLKLNRFKEAESALTRAAALDPSDHRPQLNLGLSLIRQKRYADSISFLTKCLELKPGLSDAELRLGEALLESGKMDEADKHLTTAMQANDANRPEAMLKLAIVKVEKNDQAAAIKLLESYLVDYPKASNRAQVESILKQLRP